MQQPFGWQFIDRHNCDGAETTVQLPLTGFQDYWIQFSRVIPGTDDVGLHFNLSDDGGSTFEADSGDYDWVGFQYYTVGGPTLASSATGSASDTQVEMVPESNGATNNVGNGAGEGIYTASLYIANPGASLPCGMRGETMYSTADSEILEHKFVARAKQNGPYNYIQFEWEGGTSVFSSGTILLFGLSLPSS